MKLTSKTRRPTRDPEARLHQAVADYVKARGGIVVVSGPIGLMRPEIWEPERRFRLVIECTGLPPHRGSVE